MAIAAGAEFEGFHWVSGLYGSADANGDGLVTLEEAYRYAHFKTVEHTIGSRGGVQHPSYSFDLSGQGNVVLSTAGPGSARIEWPAALTSGTYYIVDGERQLVLTAVLQPGDRTATLRVPPGSYQVRKREAGRQLQRAFSLGAGEEVQVRDADMQAVAYVERVRKGEERILREHGPRLAIGLRAGLATAMTPAIEAEGAYRLQMGWSFLQPSLAWRSPHNLTSATTHSELEIGLATGWAHGFGRLQLLAGVQTGLQIFFDSISVEGSSESVLPVGFTGSVVAEIGLTLAEGWVLSAYLRPGVLVVRADDAVRVLPAFAGGLAASYSFR